MQGTEDRYSAGAVWLHWIMAALIAVVGTLWFAPPPSVVGPNK